MVKGDRVCLIAEPEKTFIVHEVLDDKLIVIPDDTSNAPLTICLLMTEVRPV